MTKSKALTNEEIDRLREEAYRIKITDFGLKTRKIVYLGRQREGKAIHHQFLVRARILGQSSWTG